MKRITCSLAAAFFLAASLAAQGAPAAGKAAGATGEGGKRVLALFAGEVEDAEAWASSLEASLLRSGSVSAVLRASSEASASEEAARRGLDLAVEARVEVSPRIRVSWAIYAPAAPEPIASGAIELDEMPELRRLDELWEEPCAAVDAAAATLGQAGLATLTVAGPEGAKIGGLGPDELVLPAEGELSLELPYPATYPWRATLAGTMPLRGVATLGAEGARIELEPKPLRPWRIETGLLVASFPDFWVSRRFADDRFYLRFGFYQYFGGFALDGEDTPDASFFSSSPLIQPGIGGGVLFLKPDSPLRPYAGAMASLRFVIPSANLVYRDPVAPCSVGLHAGLEWRPLERWSFFFESLGELYLFGDGSLIAASRSTGGPTPLYGSSWFLDFPLMRFGARFSL